jgi:hypothetical protein
MKIEDGKQFLEACLGSSGSGLLQTARARIKRGNVLSCELHQTTLGEKEKTGRDDWKTHFLQIKIRLFQISPAPFQYTPFCTTK